MVKSAVSFDWFHSEGLTSGYFDPKMVGLCRTDVEEARLGVGACLRKQAPRFACHSRAKQNSKPAGVIFKTTFSTAKERDWSNHVIGCILIFWMKQRCCIFGRRFSHLGCRSEGAFCHLQMSWYRRIRWTCGILEDIQLQPPWWVFLFFNWQLGLFFFVFESHQTGISTSMARIFRDFCFWHCLSIFRHSNFFPGKKWYTESGPECDILRMWWIWDLKVDLFEVQNWQKASCALVGSIVSWSFDFGSPLIGWVES